MNNLFLFPFILICAGSCTMREGKKPNVPDMHSELSTIDSLLRDTAFALQMASHLDAAYYKGIGEKAPPFLAPGDETGTLVKSARDEKTATNLAGFYALESAIGLLSDQSKETPVEWLRKVADQKTDSAAAMLLNRFANATWKAGQPFRGLARIQRPIFMIFSRLSTGEIAKDAVQVRTAATKLLQSMQPVASAPLPQQMERLRSLLHDTSYALQMATYMDSAYSASQNLPVTGISPGSDQPVIKSIKEMKIATSIAGFYALECGINYLVSKTNLAPSQIMQALVSDSLSPADEMIFARFANATWKAGQPFRSLDRITRETFTPFYFLNQADIKKDLVQVKAAAGLLLQAGKF